MERDDLKKKKKKRNNVFGVKKMAVTHQEWAFTWLLSLRQRGDEEEDRAGDEQTGDEQHREREQRLVHGLASAEPVTRHAAYPGTLLRGPLDVYLRTSRHRCPG